ncbi:alpha/beta-hydrolase [Lenzites betulinus]|nr:alpha/beta-hydrolase [Lenzites betulinus]
MPAHTPARRAVLWGVLAAAAAQVLAGQVPVYNGVIGGIADTATRAQLNGALLAATDANSTAPSTTPGKLRVVENSGVCETTPGVYQASGYGDLTENQSLWFWFFAARNGSDSAPLTIWLNGGPGSSSMIGLFQENGPCRITNDSSAVTPNPYSWNNVSNMLYLDQPVGTGFSHGETVVGTSQQAAADVWKFLQMFFADAKFSKYKTADFALWTESYGGHYGPTIAAYILDQNAGIANGTVNGTAINLKTLGIGDGLTDPLAQYPGYLSYAASNPYHPLVSADTIQKATDAWNRTGGCKDQITQCNNNGNNSVCSNAQEFCNNAILSGVLGPYDPYYILSGSIDLYPPDLTHYLTQQSLMKTIGAESTWVMSSDDIYFNFADTGDWMRTSRPLLERVIDAGVRTVIYDGDADYILNFHGVEAMVDALQTKFSSTYATQTFANFTVNGTPAGLFKNAGTFSYVRIFGAGHEVPAYSHGALAVGEAAYQMFTQIMANSSLSAGALATASAGSGSATGTGGASAADPTATQPNSSLLTSTSLLTVVAAMLIAAITPL